MLFLTIARDYFSWHYTKAFGEIFHVWLNLLWFWIHFFSIPELLKSLFSPWKRVTEKRGEFWDFENLASVLIIGLISRLIGATLRGIIILAGLICLTLTIIGGFITYVFWLVAPIAILSLLLLGSSLLISNTII